MGAILAVVDTRPITFADIQAAWTANPYITYNELASYFDVSVLQIMEVIDRHISQNPAPADPS